MLPWESYFAQNEKIKGIDISHWQGDIDWSNVYNAGYKFAFAKATGGTGFIDGEFEGNMIEGHNVGMLIGAYHFAYPEYNDPVDEAQFFVSVAGEYLRVGYLRPVLDIEDDLNENSYPWKLGKEALSNWIHEFMSTVESETGVQPIIYVNKNYANDHLDTSINQYQLWIAHWTCDTNRPPDTGDTGIWNNWDFWQYWEPEPENCGENFIPGINTGGVDLDVFNGDMSRLNTFVITKPSGEQVETATGTGIAYFTSDAGTIADLTSVDELDLPLEGKPDIVFPHGFFSFNITGLAEGQTVVVTIMLPSNMPVGTQYWKYHASEGGWIQIPMGSDDGDNVITITLVDGGLGDDDGIANGKIVDQGGPGVRATKPTITKSGSTSVAPGGTITYTIEYSNAGVVDLTNVTITENYPEGITFISADPAPDTGTNNKWTLGTLPAGSSGQITINVKVPESMNLTFTESGSVTGEGFVMVSKDLSTEQKPYSLKNVVTLSCAELASVSASATTTVSGVPGTSLELTEHVSGIYSSDEILNLQTKNKSIILQKSTEAEYQPTSFNFSDGFGVNFATRWMQDICARNIIMGDAMHKKIKDASYIKDETIAEVGEYRTSMEFESSFYGAAHIGTVSKSAKTSEDYIGAFEITWAEREECRYLFNWSRVPGNDTETDSEKVIRFLVDVLELDWAENATITKSVDELSINISDNGNTATITIDENKETATVKVGDEVLYVLEVRIEDDTLNIYDCKLEEMDESVSGIGYAMLDKDLASGQMQVREHGSGNYSSDMVFTSDRLDKVTEAEYQPTSFNFSDDFAITFPSLWLQSICAKNLGEGTAIQKKISDAYSMDDDTTATKSSMAFETAFNGSMHIGARTNGTRISEDYIGVFNITELIKIGKPAISTPSTPAPDWLPCPFPEPGVSTPSSDLHCPSEP